MTIVKSNSIQSLLLQKPATIIHGTNIHGTKEKLLSGVKIAGEVPDSGTIMIEHGKKNPGGYSLRGLLVLPYEHLFGAHILEIEGQDPLDTGCGIRCASDGLHGIARLK